MKKGIENTPILVALVANDKWFVLENFDIKSRLCKECKNKRIIKEEF